MSTEKDSMLRVRLTQRQSDELDAIIDELQAQMPEASVTTSSIARYALEKYVSDHIAPSVMEPRFLLKCLPQMPQTRI